MVRCRNEPTRWPLITDVSNHLTALNPDVPDFQPGKIWKTENPSKKLNIDVVKIFFFFKLDNEINLLEKEETTANWNHVSGKRKKPIKKKVCLISNIVLLIFIHLFRKKKNKLR